MQLIMLWCKKNQKNTDSTRIDKILLSAASLCLLFTMRGQKSVTMVTGMLSNAMRIVRASQ